MLTIPVHIRRYDLSDDPVIEVRDIELDPLLQYVDLKRELQTYFQILGDDSKVIKVRNKNHVLVPMMELVAPLAEFQPYIIDVNNISMASERKASLLQDAYIDAVRQKLNSMESRVKHAEVLVPQLQCRRQAHLDQTVNKLSTRVAFLNRRIDELMPAEWKNKLPETIS